MNLPTLFVAGTVLLGSTWICLGQDGRATDNVIPNPQVQSPTPESPEPPPDATVLEPPDADVGVWRFLPFVPSYGFDVGDVGRQTQEGSPNAKHRVWEPETLSVKVSGTVQSKHIWHGFDLMVGHSVFFPAATLTLGDTGFSAKLFGAYAIGGGVGPRDELDCALFYTRDLLPDAPYATHGTLNYFYYGKPRVPSQRADAQEIGLSLSWPKLLGDGAPVPSYYFGSLWPSEHDSQVGGIAGFIHVFGLTYKLAVPNAGTQDHTQYFKLYSDLTYNDGFGGAGRGWSHMTFGTSTDLVAGKVIITPAINYQVSIKDSITPENGFWGGVTFTYRF
jgi:hypothetical protein